MKQGNQNRNWDDLREDQDYGKIWSWVVDSVVNNKGD